MDTDAIYYTAMDQLIVHEEDSNLNLLDCPPLVDLNMMHQEQNNNSANHILYMDDLDLFRISMNISANWQAVESDITHSTPSIISDEDQEYLSHYNQQDENITTENASVPDASTSFSTPLSSLSTLSEGNSPIGDSIKCYECHLCGVKFGQRFNLLKHRRNIHGINKAHECTYCGKGFHEPEYLQRHIRQTHEKKRKPKDAGAASATLKAGKTIGKTSPSKKLLLQTADNLPLNLLESLVPDMENYDGLLAVFASATDDSENGNGIHDKNAHQHQNEHNHDDDEDDDDHDAASEGEDELNPALERNHECEQCSKKYVHRRSLLAHRRKTGHKSCEPQVARPHVCGECGASYIHRRTLMSHFRKTGCKRVVAKDVAENAEC